jgi:RNA polymerase sigma-70 factor (ECF subfamily)
VTACAIGVRDAAPESADTELIERVRGGDTQAFGELVRRYQRRAFAVAWRLLGHREDAEDLVQDSFMTALDRLDSFEAGRPFGPWFLRIVVNRGHNARAARRVRAVDELPDQLEGRAPAPDAVVEAAELGEQIGAAIGELPERQRLVVQLHELEGFSSAEIADMLEIAEPTVRWTLHAARKRLRQDLAEWKGDDADA